MCTYAPACSCRGAVAVAHLAALSNIMRFTNYEGMTLRGKRGPALSHADTVISSCTWLQNTAFWVVKAVQFSKLGIQANMPAALLSASIGSWRARHAAWSCSGLPSGTTRTSQAAHAMRGASPLEAVLEADSLQCLQVDCVVLPLHHLVQLSHLLRHLHSP